MNKTEMLEILRGKVLQESPEEIQSRLNEIADELEQSERVVRCMDCKWGHDESLRCTMSDRDDWFCADAERMDEYFADLGKKVDEVSE